MNKNKGSGLPFVHHQRSIWWSQNGVGDCPAPCTTWSAEDTDEEVVQPDEGVVESPSESPTHGPLGDRGRSPEGGAECQDIKANDGSTCADKIAEAMAVDKWSGKEVGHFADYQSKLWKKGEGNCPAPCDGKDEGHHAQAATDRAKVEGIQSVTRVVLRIAPTFQRRAAKRLCGRRQ